MRNMRASRHAQRGQQVSQVRAHPRLLDCRAKDGHPSAITGLLEVGSPAERGLMDTEMRTAIAALRKSARRKGKPVADRTAILADNLELYAREPNPELRKFISDRVAELERAIGGV